VAPVFVLVDFYGEKGEIGKRFLVFGKWLRLNELAMLKAAN